MNTDIGLRGLSAVSARRLLATLIGVTSHYFSRQLDDETPFQPTQIEVSCLNQTLRFATGNGVFSRRDLDEGTRILLETVDLTGAEIVGDLGCGWGAVACFISSTRLDAKVLACDINFRATQLAHQNLETNNLTNAYVWCGDGFSSVRDNSFDAILFNPPIRAGNIVIQKLFDDAHRTLKSGGHLWLVLRTAQGAKSWAKKLEIQFGNCEVVAIEKGYRVLKCAR